MSKKYFGFKRVLAMLMTVCMVVSLLPVSAFAEETETCPDCGGTGKALVDCPECEDGLVRCEACDSSGEVEGNGCNACGGEGSFDTGDEPIDCSACGGNGYFTEKCGDCDGKGNVACESCEQGKVEGDCPTCNGTGHVAAEPDPGENPGSSERDYFIHKLYGDPAEMLRGDTGRFQLALRERLDYGGQPFVEGAVLRITSENGGFEFLGKDENGEEISLGDSVELNNQEYTQLRRVSKIADVISIKAYLGGSLVCEDSIEVQEQPWNKFDEVVNTEIIFLEDITTVKPGEKIAIVPALKITYQDGTVETIGTQGGARFNVGRMDTEAMTLLDENDNDLGGNAPYAYFDSHETLWLRRDSDKSFSFYIAAEYGDLLYAGPMNVDISAVSSGPEIVGTKIEFNLDPATMPVEEPVEFKPALKAVYSDGTETILTDASFKVTIHYGNIDIGDEYGALLDDQPFAYGQKVLLYRSDSDECKIWVRAVAGDMECEQELIFPSPQNAEEWVLAEYPDSVTMDDGFFLQYSVLGRCYINGVEIGGEVVLISSVTSSDDSIVRVNQTEEYRWEIEPVGLGEATLTIQGKTLSDDSPLELTHKLTVTEGEAADPYDYDLTLEVPERVLSTSTTPMNVELTVYRYNEATGSYEPTEEEIDGLTYAWYVEEMEYGEGAVSLEENGASAELCLENYTGRLVIRVSALIDDREVIYKDFWVYSADTTYSIEYTPDPAEMELGKATLFTPTLMAARVGEDTPTAVESVWFDVRYDGAFEILNENGEWQNSFGPGEKIQLRRRSRSAGVLWLYASVTEDSEPVCILKIEIPALKLESDGTLEAIFLPFAEYVTVLNDSTCPFNKSSKAGYDLESTNHEDDSVGYFTITAVKDCKISFDYQVSSEDYCDRMVVATGDDEILLDGSGIASGSFLGELKAGKSLLIGYTKDGGVNNGDDCARLRNIMVQPPCEHEYKDGICTICGVSCTHEFENGACVICGAVDAAAAALSGINAAVANDPYYPWVASAKSGYAIMSGNREMGGTASVLTITAREPMVLSFDYAVSSEPSFDWLKTGVNGVGMDSFSGNRTGTLAYELAPGDVLEVAYQKDSSADYGDDRAYLGNFKAFEIHEHTFANGQCTICHMGCSMHEIDENNICIICGADLTPKWIANPDYFGEMSIMGGHTNVWTAVPMIQVQGDAELKQDDADILEITSSDPELASVLPGETSGRFDISYLKPGTVTLTFRCQIDDTEVTVEQVVHILAEEFWYGFEADAEAILPGGEATVSLQYFRGYLDENNVYHEEKVPIPEGITAEWSIVTHALVGNPITLNVSDDTFVATVTADSDALGLDFEVLCSVYDAEGEKVDWCDIEMTVTDQVFKISAPELEKAELFVGVEQPFTLRHVAVTADGEQSVMEGGVFIAVYDTGNVELYYKGVPVTVDGMNIDLADVAASEEPPFVLKATGEGHIAIYIHSDAGGTAVYSFDAQTHVHADEDDDSYCDLCGEWNYPVLLESRLVTGESSVAELSGGGAYWPGDSVTVTASAKPGFSFVGWYDIDLKHVSSSLSYTFEMEDRLVLLTAMYQSNDSVSVTVTAANGGAFTVGDSATVQTEYRTDMPIGTRLVLTAADPENVSAWVNGSSKIISTQGSVSIVITGKTDITLRYKAVRENQAMVEFISDYNQIVGCQSYTAEQTIDFPAGPTKTGWIFDRWDMDEETIHSKIAAGETHITVRPLYTKNNIEYTVTVHYPDGDETYLVPQGNTINIPAKAIDGKTFSCWKDSAGNVLGYTDPYFLRAVSDVTIIPCYDEEVQAEPVAVMEAPRAFVDGTKNKVAFTMTYDVPDGYTLVEAGILRSMLANDEETLVINGENVKKHTSALQTNMGSYTVNISVGTSVEVIIYARGYAIVTDNTTGNTAVIYSDVVSGSFNSISNG